MSTFKKCCLAVPALVRGILGKRGKIESERQRRRKRKEVGQGFKCLQKALFVQMDFGPQKDKENTKTKTDTETKTETGLI